MCHYLPMLKHYKIKFGYEMYLDILPSKLENILTKLRLSSHKVRIESRRLNRNRTPKELRYCMALRGIQEYIARDANNIAQVKDEGNIYSISGNIFLYPPKKSHPILLLLLLFI